MALGSWAVYANNIGQTRIYSVLGRVREERCQVGSHAGYPPCNRWWGRASEERTSKRGSDLATTAPVHETGSPANLVIERRAAPFVVKILLICAIPASSGVKEINFNSFGAGQIGNADITHCQDRRQPALQYPTSTTQLHQKCERSETGQLHLGRSIPGGSLGGGLEEVVEFPARRVFRSRKLPRRRRFSSSITLCLS